MTNAINDDRERIANRLDRIYAELHRYSIMVREVDGDLARLTDSEAHEIGRACGIIGDIKASIRVDLPPPEQAP